MTVTHFNHFNYFRMFRCDFPIQKALVMGMNLSVQKYYISMPALYKVSCDFTKSVSEDLIDWPYQELMNWS